MWKAEVARGAFSGATFPLTDRVKEASCATRGVEHAEGYQYKYINLSTKGFLCGGVGHLRVAILTRDS